MLSGVYSFFFFFFFKQKTAYEMLRSLVGSEMCIRDSSHTIKITTALPCALNMACLLYTSDAADEEDSVDLGGRRIIKKKKKKTGRGGVVIEEKIAEEVR
eukprot:TRINITY_DN2308_c0_g1_i2.p1 TRINITY_DN2308_c0_g1~~TRINITY_DN2308_c0_g1_i2.p1  ORF type:complete len:100 (-),score=46.91 TRINITY_DN2308_c0_g1_i2:36-335(-)